MRIHARHYATGERIELICTGGTIQSIGPTFRRTDFQSVREEVRIENPSYHETADIEAEYVAPAFFDLQINGGYGVNFGSESLTSDQIHTVVGKCRQHGIGAFFPTLVTNSFKALRHGMATLHQAIETDNDLARSMPGIHLEGPYISAEDGPRGAHPREHVRPPDWDEFQRLQQAAAGRIRLVTLSPEYDHSLDLIARLVRSGVVVAIGHTAASSHRIRDAVSAGARLSTHLGNGCHRMLPRHDNYLWEQLAADDLWASIISDGHHLPPSVLRCIVRMKTPSRLIITCDASSLAGLPPGRYTEWGQAIDVLPEGKIVVVQQGVLAGAWAFTDTCVGKAVRLCGVSLSDAVDMATQRPRQLLGLPPQRLEPTMPADLILFNLTPDGDLRVTHTIVGGKIVFRRT